ncbi:hypothetical protein P8452_17486 [Trifolium repens]|nr:hypothetical protein P8452_17486 [Trifolium repens]
MLFYSVGVGDCNGGIAVDWEELGLKLLTAEAPFLSTEQLAMRAGYSPWRDQQVSTAVCLFCSFSCRFRDLRISFGW